jgi:hypothetical protein
VTSFGLGLVVVPLSLVSLHNVANQDSGVASNLFNTGQQVGGAIGLALLDTGPDCRRGQRQNSGPGKASWPLPKPGTAPPASFFNHALAVGFSRGFNDGAGSRCSPCLKRSPLSGSAAKELNGAVPELQEAAPQPATSQPGTVQRHEHRAALAKAVRPLPASMSMRRIDPSLLDRQAEVTSSALGTDARMRVKQNRGWRAVDTVCAGLVARQRVPGPSDRR